MMGNQIQPLRFFRRPTLSKDGKTSMEALSSLAQVICSSNILAQANALKGNKAMSKSYIDEYHKWFGEATFDEEEIHRIQNALEIIQEG